MDMANVSGFKKFEATLKAKLAKAKAGGGRVSVHVGYTQNYAIYVHENLNAKHPVGKAKFLEDPFKELSPKAGRIVAAHMKQGKTLEEAIVLLGLLLQRNSQEEVPIDTGALRASAFTRLEGGATITSPTE